MKRPITGATPNLEGAKADLRQQLGVSSLGFAFLPGTTLIELILVEAGVTAFSSALKSFDSLVAAMGTPPDLLRVVMTLAGFLKKECENSNALTGGLATRLSLSAKCVLGSDIMALWCWSMNAV
jgi:hypothetical protein